MNASQPSLARLEARRDACLKKLANIGPAVRGSLCAVKRGNALAHQLTVSVKGKTHTVYVPVDRVEEVREWIHNRKMLEKWLVEISKLNMAILHAHVPEKRRDADRNKRRRPSRPPSS
jgi:hypothetical protein